ncbi:MAG: hypothetical protein AB7P03_01375 [Kofleriaceae bacterium]
MTPTLTRRCFHAVPLTIYVALLIGVISQALGAFAWLGVGDDLFSHREALRRVNLIATGCYFVSTVMFALGTFELANRSPGRARTVGKVAGWLSLVALATFLRPVSELFVDDIESRMSMLQWIGRALGVLGFAAALLFTIAADSWRRAPVASVLLVVVHLTSWWVPYLGEALSDLLGAGSIATLTRYRFCMLGWSVAEACALLFIASAMAARGCEPTGDFPVAIRGLRLARGALLYRLMFALAIALLALSAQSPSGQVILMFAAPIVAIVTMGLFAAGTLRAASARLDGMPRLAVVLGTTLVLLQCGVQLNQVANLAGSVSSDLRFRDADDLAMFSVLGPVIATLGMAMIGVAIGVFASRRDDEGLWSSAAQRTIGFVLLSLFSIWVQSRLPETRSHSKTIVMLLAAAAANVFSLVSFAGLLGRTANRIAEMVTPEIPAARVVSGPGA